MSKQANVTLLDYTGKGAHDPSDYAAGILIMSRSTRLTMSPGLLEQILEQPKSWKLEELKKASMTIPSSWEFVNYTFLIENVTRAFTHQFVRTRTASYAQQTMRILDVSEGPGWSAKKGPTVLQNKIASERWDNLMSEINSAYRDMISSGVSIEDARGVLPTNICTNIMASMNMRTFVDLVRKRSSLRVQEEYREVIAKMVERVREVHEWIDLFVNSSKDVAKRQLDQELNQLMKEGKISSIKLIDLLKLSDKMITD